jgi:hypothetical protein
VLHFTRQAVATAANSLGPSKAIEKDHDKQGKNRWAAIGFDALRSTRDSYAVKRVGTKVKAA